MAADLDQLARLFSRLGAPEPEQWARSQVEEGINQLHRYLDGGWWRPMNDDPTRMPIGGLHESVLETDPTGREMRPRGLSQ